MDAAAAKTGIERTELRRRNLPSPSELPYTNWAGVAYDSGDYPRLLEDGLKRANQAGFAARKAESAKRGKLRGFGFAYYVEITGAAGRNLRHQVHRQWRRRALLRHAVERAGPRNLLRATGRRKARRALRSRSR